MTAYDAVIVGAGPGSPSVLSNVILASEQHLQWLENLLQHARTCGIDEVGAEVYPGFRMTPAAVLAA